MALSKSSRNFAMARALALVVPVALLGGALAFQYLGGLYPCEMCWWQRYGHIAGLVFALAAFVVPGRRFWVRPRMFGTRLSGRTTSRLWMPPATRWAASG